MPEGHFHDWDQEAEFDKFITPLLGPLADECQKRGFPLLVSVHMGAHGGGLVSHLATYYRPVPGRPSTQQDLAFKMLVIKGLTGQPKAKDLKTGEDIQLPPFPPTSN